MPAAALLAAANITISAIAPREASILGGTELTLTGSGFGSASSGVTGVQPDQIPVMVVHRAELGPEWAAIEFQVSGVNGTAALMTEAAAVYWVDDVVLAQA